MVEVLQASQIHPLYLESGAQRLFGVFHESPGSDVAVLIVAPWGWEETASYRCRRAWAQGLAAAGHPTLRLELSGVGDSSGSPGDPGLFEGWVEAVSDAVSWLSDRSGARRIAVLGLGFGGLLAAAASESGADIDELILWATPSRGKRFLREAESFARMQAWGEGRGEETPMPEGWIEAGGFVISAETAAALRALPDPLTSVPPRLRRVLLLDRDGLSSDKGLAARLEAAGVDATVASGPGWGGMVVHPERAEFPRETAERVGAWLVLGNGTDPDPRASGRTPASSPRMTLTDPEITEYPITVAHPDVEIFGVVSEPPGERADLCAVYLNAGAVRHIGPNRNWVENARRWAARGVPAVRIDLEGIGEAGGDRSQHPRIAGFYDEAYGSQVAAVLDELERLGFGSRFICIGLCAGAYWSLRFAERDPRVTGAVLLNAGAIFWDQDLRSRRQGRLLSRAVSSGDSWRRLLRGDVDLKVKAAFLRALIASWLRRGSRVIAPRPEADDATRDPAALFDRLRAADKRIALAFCANEPVYAELKAEGILERLDEWPNMEFEVLEGEDHALGPIGAQRHGARVVDRELELAITGSLVGSESRRS